jgi:hypothetical protein
MSSSLLLLVVPISLISVVAIGALLMIVPNVQTLECQYATKEWLYVQHLVDDGRAASDACPKSQIPLPLLMPILLPLLRHRQVQ